MRDTIRFALPSKGRLAEESFEFLERCGLRVYRPNERQYIATIPALPNVQVILQRPSDIALGVGQGSLDFGITGRDVMWEKNFDHPAAFVIVHDGLAFGKCSLNIAAPDSLPIVTVDQLREWMQTRPEPLRVGTKFTKLTADFFQRQQLTPYELIESEGTLEIAPTIGYADIIVDLVSSGITLRDNHLHLVQGGEILRSEAILVGNRDRLQRRPDVLALARRLLEYIEAHLRAKESVMVIANMRGESAEKIAEKMFAHAELSGLRGPTIAPIYPRQTDGHLWFSVSIAIHRHELDATISALRSIGGSGVIVTPALYIFDEEPSRYRALLHALELAPQT